MNSITIFLFSCIIPCFSSCHSKVDYYHVSSFSDTGAVNAVIEIPAGTNVKYEYDNILNEFIIDQEDDMDRTIDFMPYPSNYGFIPSTISNKLNGGDGDALDIVVISESKETGTIMEVLPIGILKLRDKGELDFKIIAVPVNNKEKIIYANTYDELIKNYPAIVEIIELWFLNYNKKDKALIEGWGNEHEAMDEIKRAMKK